eukprot:CAMPEP_0197599226 /NCGR_PEP_ID=MMETSP1326-20131121/30921_1 /TAXON_ID=1155430 /ORGANISM="Genus nov. species nov., Strain RCC2288" /LENGTH=44 /DNA_ID= /DNA_START= /DNA_END= /DNA_ORIENTATION=
MAHRFPPPCAMQKPPPELHFSQPGYVQRLPPPCAAQNPPPASPF